MIGKWTEANEQEYYQLLLEEDYDRCEKSLSSFVQSAWHTIEPGTQYNHNWHIDLICEYLTAVCLKQIKRLIINIPYRYSKSILASVMFPTWMWLQDPASRWIFASYAQDLSTELSLKRRRVIQSEWYQARWVDRYRIVTDQNIKTWFTNNKEGAMLASSVGGSITGRGGNYLLGDDLLKAEEAFSKVKRDSANLWFDQTFSTRLNDRKKDAIIIIQHRLHKEDTTGHLLKKKAQEYQYEVLSLPLIAEKKTIITYPISKKQIVREENDLLWPEMDNWEEIADKKESLGSFGFAAQCQQYPEELGGEMIKRHWWQYYRELPNYSMKFQSLDTALETKDENAYSVCLTAVECDNGWYITDVWRYKVESPELKRAVKQLYNKELPDEVLIEKKASGHGLIQELRRETRMPVKGIEVDKDKVSRVNAVSPTIEAGRVFLPEDAPWVIDFVDELAIFPHGAYNDQVDALTQLLIYRKKATIDEPGSFGTPDQGAQAGGSGRLFQAGGGRIF